MHCALPFCIAPCSVHLVGSAVVESHLVLVPDVYKASEIRSESGITIQLYKAVVRLWKMVHIEATRYETQKVPTMIQMQFKVTISLYSPNKRARSLSTLVAAIVSKETPHNAEPMMFIGEHDELCIAVYFKCFNLEGKKNSTTNCEKGIPQRGNIESQYQNKLTYWTAGKRARARHYSLQVRNRRIFGLLVKIDEAEKPLFCTSHDGPTCSVSF